MRHALRAIAALAFLCAFAIPLEAKNVGCAAGTSLNDIRQVGGELVASGAIEELLILEGDSLKHYAEALNAAYDAGVPANLSHILIAVRLDGSAVLFGFADGCRTGIANLPPGVHGKIRGKEIGAPPSRILISD